MSFAANVHTYLCGIIKQSWVSTSSLAQHGNKNSSKWFVVMPFKWGQYCWSVLLLPETQYLLITWTPVILVDKQIYKYIHNFFYIYSLIYIIHIHPSPPKDIDDHVWWNCTNADAHPTDQVQQRLKKHHNYWQTQKNGDLGTDERRVEIPIRKDRVIIHS